MKSWGSDLGYIVGGKFMAIPEDVSLNDIDTTFLGVLNQTWPHLRERSENEA